MRGLGKLGSVLGTIFTLVGGAKKIRNIKDEAQQAKELKDGTFELHILRFLHEKTMSEVGPIRVEVSKWFLVRKGTATRETAVLLETLMKKGEIRTVDHQNKPGAKTGKTLFYTLTDKGRLRINVPLLNDGTVDAVQPAPIQEEKKEG